MNKILIVKILKNKNARLKIQSCIFKKLSVGKKYLEKIPLCIIIVRRVVILHDFRIANNYPC